jgi:hypothetical protein
MRHAQTAKHSAPVVLQPPYSPDLAPCSWPGWRSPWRGEDFKTSRRYNWIRHDGCRPSRNMRWKVVRSHESLHMMWRIVLRRRQLRVSLTCLSCPTTNSFPDLSHQPSYVLVFSSSVSSCLPPPFLHRKTEKIMLLRPLRCAHLPPRLQLQNQPTDFHRTWYEHYASGWYLKAVLWFPYNQ